MKETLVIELQNTYAYKLLENLEQLNIIHIISRGDQKDYSKNLESSDTMKVNQNPEDKKEADWYKLGGSQLSKAYSDTEPDYDLSMLKEPNPDIKNEGR